MATWHQLKAGIPFLGHATLWTCYKPAGHLSVIRFESEEAAKRYSEKTGDIIIPPGGKK